MLSPILILLPYSINTLKIILLPGVYCKNHSIKSKEEFYCYEVIYFGFILEDRIYAQNMGCMSFCERWILMIGKYIPLFYRDML